MDSALRRGLPIQITLRWAVADAADDRVAEHLPRASEGAHLVGGLVHPVGCPRSDLLLVDSPAGRARRREWLRQSEGLAQAALDVSHSLLFRERRLERLR